MTSRITKPIPRGWPRGPVLPDVLTGCSIALIAPLATVVLVAPAARPDPGEEDVCGSVFGLRGCQCEGGGEPATEPGQPLVFAYVVVRGKRCGSQVGRAGDVRLPP